MAIFDASYTMTSAAEADIRKYEDGTAMSERIREWLDTPEGTVAHDPSWGHNLIPFKFEPQSNDLAIQIEMSITRKLPLDVEDIEIKSVEVTFLEKDMIKLVIVHQFGADSLEVTL